MAAGPDIAIEVKNLSKLFRIPHEKHATLKAAALNIFHKRSYTELHALEDINFEVRQGEFFGIIGKNGCGKSTLLKIIAGIYVPSGGNVNINGRISPFLELGVGFNPELTARENVFLGGSILGLTRRQIEEKFEEIVRFSELQEFIDMKFKNFSSGMQVRLAFSLAIHAHAEILLMDEVLAVGDTNFQNKCLEEFNRYKEQGKTVVLVTHDTSVVDRYCDRAMLLRDGKIEIVGEAEPVVHRYLRQNMIDEETRIEEARARDSHAPRRAGTGGRTRAVIKSIKFLDESGNSCSVFETGEDIIIRVDFDKSDEVSDINFGIGIYNQENVYIFGVNTLMDKTKPGKSIEDGFFQIRFPNIRLKTNSYYVKSAIVGRDYSQVHDFMEKSPSFKIFSTSKSEGSVELDHSWDV